MVFSSNLFLFGFLPLFLTIYYLAPKKYRSAFILLASYFFYAWWRPEFLFLLVLTTTATYLIAIQIASAECLKIKKYWVTVGIVANLATLAYFKYANFGVDSFNYLIKAIGFEAIEMANIILPIGLSFYIFHAISYLIDIYRKEALPARNLIDFSAFIALFPHLVAGPVLRYHLLAEQFHHRVHSWSNFSRGCTIFMVGFCKKVLIADTVAPLADAAFAIKNPSMMDAWLGTIAYTIQLFFDFSGYTDMAIGLALMIGFVFPQNFNDPYTSKSITEFWQRWHMSLSSWLREYLYIPLGGNKKGTRRTYINLFLTMLLGGLWHGANWTFVVWGAWHGGILAIERYLKSKFGDSILPSWLRIIKTMLLVMIGWIFFRAIDLDNALQMLRGLIGLNGFDFSNMMQWQIEPDRLGILFVAIFLVYAMPWLHRYRGGPMRYLLIPLFFWAVATLSAQNFTPFLYFQF